MTNKQSIKLLYVDLTEQTTRTMKLAPEFVRHYIGGTGLAARMLWDETQADTAPFSEENVLIFMIGPLTGTIVPASSRYVAASISPLTGIWGESYGGGSFPRALSRTPYRGIVIKGKAKGPVTLWIDGSGARIASAEHLWGKDTFAVDEILKKEAGPKAGVITIGVAGEKQVKMAAIVGDGKAARVAARCGLGAVMGWKMLKAVVVSAEGGRKPWVFDREGLAASVKEYFPSLHYDPDEWPARAHKFWAAGRPMVSVRNYAEVEFPGFMEKCYHLGLNVKPCYCLGCRSGCFLSMYRGDHKLPPGQHMETFGSNCGIDDMDALLEAFALCDRLGLDCISAGQTLALAMELYQKGLLSRKECDNIELVWGNAQAMLEIIRKIGNREGIGALLGEGVRNLADKLGGNASEYAMHAKGLEFPRYDPRSNNAVGLQYATGSRGASHMEGFVGIVLKGLHIGAPPYAAAYMKSEEGKRAATDVLAIGGVPELVVWSQNFDSSFDSLGVCKFLSNPTVWIREPEKGFMGIKPGQYLSWLNSATGWDMSYEDFFKAGERIFNLKRAFNVRRGISREDDTLPRRILTEPRGGTEPDADNLPPLAALLGEYYHLRGWDSQGIPTEDKLRELDLWDIIG